MRNDLDRISIFSFGRRFITIYFSLFIALIIGYTICVIYKVNGLISVVNEVSRGIPVAITIILTIEWGGGILMLLWHWFKRDIENRARKEGRVEGKNEGVEQTYALFLDWNNRRLEAEKRGDPFDEPFLPSSDSKPHQEDPSSSTTTPQ